MVEDSYCNEVKKRSKKQVLAKITRNEAKKNSKDGEIKETKEKKEMGLRNEKEKLTKYLDDAGGFGIVLEKLRKS